MERVLGLITFSGTNEFLQKIWESWPQLEVLKMVLSHFDGCLDSGITGVGMEDCFEIRNEQNYDDIRIEDVKVAPSISDLHGM